MSPPYTFRVSWTVPFPLERVHALLVDLERYPEWWPQVRAVAKLGEDDALVVCRSVMPTRSTWCCTPSAASPPRDHLTGDLEGVVRWYLADLGAETRMDFEQHVEVTGRLLRLVSRAGRPVMVWNHERMMRGCQAGLCDRLG
jgi:uncharacterized protein YndB with AHSA1/START domain